MKLLQKTFVTNDPTELDFLCNEFRNKFKVNFSQSNMAIAMNENQNITQYMCVLFYEVQ